MRMQIETIIDATRQRIRLTKGEILKRLGVGRTQQAVFRKRRETSAVRMRRANEITPDEQTKAVAFAEAHRGVNYIKLAYMMMDAAVTFIRPSTLYKILEKNGFFKNSPSQSSAAKEYKDKPTRVHAMWHTDIAYVNIFGVFYFLIVMLDGFSRYVLDWQLLSDMTGRSVADFAQRVLDKYPEARTLGTKIVNDNGSCYVSSDYRLVLKRNDVGVIYAAPHHPETNGKAEALIKIVRAEALRPYAPQVREEAVVLLTRFFREYNEERLHSGIGYLRPADVFFGRVEEVKAKRASGYQDAVTARAAWNEAFNRSTLASETEKSLSFSTANCSV